MATAKSFIPLLLLFISAHLGFGQYDPQQALEYAQISSISNCNPGQIKSMNCGPLCESVSKNGYKLFYSTIIKIENDQSLAFTILYNPTKQRVVVSFRGTVGGNQLWSEAKQSGAEPYTLKKINNALINNYFFDHYMTYVQTNFLAQLQRALQSAPHYTYVFTGHSLGAALATIAAFDVVSSGHIPKQQILLYNFGSPRVGNYNLVKAIEDALPQIYRVVHWNDIVPHLPSCNTFSLLGCGDSSVSATSTSTTPQLWHPWHVSQQIFYNEDSSSYKVCGEEDIDCADQFSLLFTSIKAHYIYLGVNMETCLNVRI